MTARILVVDDIPVNVRLLEARLRAEYFEVVTAYDGFTALEICKNGGCDLVLLDAMMPEIDGFEVCRQLKSNPETAHLPIVMVTALSQPADRLRGLEAGADDFLTKPVNDVVMLARVRSLLRLKSLTDELRNRLNVMRKMGMSDPLDSFAQSQLQRGKIMLVEDKRGASEKIRGGIAAFHDLTVETTSAEAFQTIYQNQYDLIIVSLSLENTDGLRFCSQIRSQEKTRTTPMLAIVEADQQAEMLRGLDLGINDFLLRPLDQNELVARIATQIRWKRLVDCLRQNVSQSIEMSMIDPLTNIGNRRAMEKRLIASMAECLELGQDLSIIMLDLDKFKSINDTYGHEAGDDVLKQCAERLKDNIRPIDFLARLGGEEFLVAMPGLNNDYSSQVAERIRMVIEQEPFVINAGTRRIFATASLGVSSLQGLLNAGMNPPRADVLIHWADDALYAAKRNGRNQVMAAA